MASGWKRFVREPLLHFVVIGATMFALHHLGGGSAAAPATDDEIERRIVVTRAVREELAAGFERAERRAPTAAELDAAVERWVNEEILYREGRRRGLERDDPRVRDRVAAKMGFVIRAQVVVPEPTDAELRTWLEQRRERFTEQERVDFTHVFLAGEAGDPALASRAQEIQTQLAAGASPARMGDSFSGGRRYRRRTLADLSGTFGPGFAAGVAEQQVGSWATHVSRFGHHVVRVDSRTPAGTADFATLRPELRHDWMEARRDREASAAGRALRDQWQITREP